MLETDEDVVTALRIVGFLFLLAGVFPSIILTPVYVIASIMPHSEPFFYLQILSVFYVISALGYFSL